MVHAVAAVHHHPAVAADDLVPGVVAPFLGAAADALELSHRRVEALFAEAHLDDVVAHAVEQRHIGGDAENQTRVGDGAQRFQGLQVERTVALHFQHVEAHAQVAGFVVVDLGERLVAHRVVHGFQQEGAERAVQGDLQHRNHRAEHFQGHVVAVAVQPLDHQLQVLVGLGNVVAVEHAPALHQRHFRIGVALLLGVEVGVDFLERVVGRFLGHGREPARADVLDPHQIGHEGFQLGPLLGGDPVGAGSVPVDVRQGPLAGFDFGEHFFEIDGSHACLLPVRNGVQGLASVKRLSRPAPRA